MSRVSIDDLIAAAKVGAGDTTVTVAGAYERVVERYFTEYDNAGKYAAGGWKTETREPIVIVGFTTSGTIIRREAGYIDCQPFGYTETGGTQYERDRKRTCIRMVPADA